jgi:hypothetical protein
MAEEITRHPNAIFTRDEILAIYPEVKIPEGERFEMVTRPGGHTSYIPSESSFNTPSTVVAFRCIDE